MTGDEFNPATMEAIAGLLGADDPEALQVLLAFASKAASPVAALGHFETWLRGVGGETVARALEEEPDTIAALLQIFGWCETDSEWILQHAPTLDDWRDTILFAQPADRETLLRELTPAIDAEDVFGIKRAFRRVYRREVLRILVLDLLHDVQPQRIALFLSDLADALLQAALRAAIRLTLPPDCALSPDANLGLCIFALGKLGGREVNYSSDIDLMFAHGGEHTLTLDDNREIRVGGDVLTAVVVAAIGLLHDQTADGSCYRVDTRLRPDGASGPLARSAEACRKYYLQRGRVWERQALLKARAAAGDIELGQSLLRDLEPFIFQRELEYAAIQDIKNLKQRIEQRTEARGEADREIKTGFGGIRDIEFTVQFLQLIHGVHTPELRTPNTFEALPLLRAARCINPRDAVVLIDAYAFLRKLEHRLQARRHLQTHLLPEDENEIFTLARVMGYQQDSLRKFDREHARHRRETRKTLDRVLRKAFESGSDTGGREIEWLLGAASDPAAIRAALADVGFENRDAAMKCLQALANEHSAFLPPNPELRRSFANIVTPLLQRLRATDRPDEALANFERCIRSLGGAAMLYRLFADTPQALHIFVDLAMWSPPLVDILTREPGILDQVMDSLMIGRYKSLDILRDELRTMLPGFDELAPALIAFKNQELLRIGIRDLQQKESLLNIMTELSDLAEAILDVACARVYADLCAEYGAPESRFALLALGKLGGRELNYNSDLDVVCIYESNGELPGGMEYKRFFKQLLQRLIAALSGKTAQGDLYELDPRLRPEGASGSLVISLRGFLEYHADGGGAQLWEKQVLLKARPCAGDRGFGAELMDALPALFEGLPSEGDIKTHLREMRARIEADHDRDLKKGTGGLVDIEFAVQCMQLIAARRGLPCFEAHTYHATQKLAESELCNEEQRLALSANYLFLRRVENRIRIASSLPADTVPASAEEADQLARRLGWSGDAPGEELLADLAYNRAANRALFNDILG